MTASNTKDCFRACVGKRITGLLFDTLPLNRTDLSAGSKTIIFDDGSGLTIASNGSFWLESENEVARGIKSKKRALELVKQDIREVVDLAKAADAKGRKG